MAQWDHHWEINGIIEDYKTTTLSDEESKQLATRITEYLKERPLVDDEQTTITENFSCVADGDALEYALEELFNWADWNAIWLGTP
tara:strand:+ start:71 stop:328 length:258 start_codon:yes stop_codon:yes gene_type:complete